MGPALGELQCHSFIVRPARPRSVWVLDLKTLAFERVKKQGEAFWWQVMVL